jgi:hypothetical protein
MQPVDSSALPISYYGTCGPEKGTKCDYSETPASPPDYVVSYSGEAPAEHTPSEEPSTATAVATSVGASSAPKAPVAMPETEPQTSGEPTEYSLSAETSAVSAAVVPVNLSPAPVVSVNTEPEILQSAIAAPTVETTPTEPEVTPAQSSTTPSQPYIGTPLEATTVEPTAWSPSAINVEATAATFLNPASSTAEPPSNTTTSDWAINDTFNPDPGYVNPNWRPHA